jgi:hypothetical protein
MSHVSLIDRSFAECILKGIGHRFLNGKAIAPGFSYRPSLGSPAACRRPPSNVSTLPWKPWWVTGGYAQSFNKRFLLDLAEDWQQHGREVFKRVRRESPASYLKVCAMLVPKEMRVEHSAAAAIKELTDEQLDQAIAAIQDMLDRRAGDDAKVIEGEATPSLPAPTAVNAKSP